MRWLLSLLTFGLYLYTSPLLGQTTIYIAPQGGFESYLAAGLIKKAIPAQIIDQEAKADYTLRSSPVESHTVSTGSQVARCLFLYCGGINGSNSVSVQLLDRKTGSVVWAYNVRKQGHGNYQSSAEACAKHLKNWLEHTGK